jgi:hypothetical protein
LTTLVLLDTNAYLRLAKRIKPLLGKKFGQKEYVLTVLRDVEDEVHRNPRLQSKFPWFDGADFASERLAKTIRFNADEKEALAAATSVLHGFVLADPGRFLGRHRSPPSRTDWPDERLPWPQTAAMGVQHVIAMFGATVLAPILMGFDPNIAILMSGIGTLIFFLITGGKVPSYLGSSFAFIGVVIAATATRARAQRQHRRGAGRHHRLRRGLRADRRHRAGRSARAGSSASCRRW